MNVSTNPADAPRRPVTDRPNSRTDASTASSADVPRRSCSSGPVIPEVGINRAACQVSSAIPAPSLTRPDASDIEVGCGQNGADCHQSGTVFFLPGVSSASYPVGPLSAACLVCLSIHGPAGLSTAD